MFARRPLTALAVLTLVTASVVAQTPKKQKAPIRATPDCVSGCSGPFAVGVSPYWGSARNRTLNQAYTDSFYVTNEGTQSDTYDFTCSATGGITCGTVTPLSATLLSGHQITVAVSYTVGSGGGWATLTATGEAVDSGGILVTVPYGVLVTPDGGSAIARPANTTGWTQVFTVKNAGANQDTYALSCTASAHITCAGTNPTNPTLASGASTAVTVTYNTGAVGTDTLTLHAVGVASDTGTFVVPIVLGTPTIALRNHNRDNRNRALCLTVGVGEAGAWQCGDLLMSHAMPGYATMGHERSLTLLYNSAQAVPKPFVAVSVNETAVPTPTTVYAEVKVNGAIRDSATYSGWGAAVRQVVLAYDASADASGVYPATVTIRNQYPGGSYDATVNDTVLVVNRSQSEFGSGWWLAGVEQLVLSQPGNTILWVDGDASAVLYRSIGTNLWQAAAGGFRDTLRYDPIATTYTRTLHHGVQVVFDAAGRHLKTVNRVGQVSTFTWGGTPVRLTSIQVPPAGASGTAYTIAYDGSNKLDRLTDPAGRVLDATVTASRLTQLVDPDTTAYHTDFTYDAGGRLLTRTSRRGYTTAYAYGKALRVDSVKVPLDVVRHDTATTIFQPWDEQGLHYGTGLQTAVDTSTAYTKVDGPRIDAADTADFWVDRWGAPVRILNPLGATTIISRGSGTVPALPTSVTFADGRITLLTWDARANLLQMRDSTWHLGAALRLPTTSKRWTYQATGVPDSPDSLLDSTETGALVTRLTYNTLGLPSTAVLPNGHVTRFGYDSIAGDPLIGVLRAVTDLVVPVWDSASASEINSTLSRTFGYNNLGNVIADTSPMLHVTRYTRDAAQRVDTMIDPMGHRTDLVYDALNRTLKGIRHIEGDTLLVTRQHYAIDVLDSIIDPRGVARVYQYDAGGRQTAETDDFGHTELRFFDRAGLVDSVQPRYYALTGDKVRMRYDAAGQASRLVWPARTPHPAGDSTIFVRDIMERVTSAKTSQRLVTRAYYGTGALKSEVQSDLGGTNPFTNTYGYDHDGRRAWYVVGTPGSATASDSIWYHYDPGSGDLRWIGVRWRGTVTPARQDSVRLAWDALGRRDTVTYHNGAVIRFAYDADGGTRIVCGQHSGPLGDPLDFTSYNKGVDADGLAKVIAHAPPNSGCGGSSGLSSVTNTFDARHQLLSQGLQFLDTWLYGFDASGNLTRMNDSSSSGTLVQGMVTLAGHNQLHRLDRGGADSTVYLYDDNGNRINEVYYCSGCDTSFVPNHRHYFYDGLGRMTGAQTFMWDGTEYTWVGSDSYCLYDPLGRLYHACDGSSPLLGFDGNNVVRTAPDGQNTATWTFVQGPGVDDPIMGHYWSNGASGDTFAYWETDGQGRFIAVANPTGYDCSGGSSSCVLPVSQGGNYASGTRNATSFSANRDSAPSIPQLSLFRNRFYDQKTGRWTQEDPLGVAGGLNLYQYVGNDPVALTDPFGLSPECDTWKEKIRAAFRTLEQKVTTYKDTPYDRGRHDIDIKGRQAGLRNEANRWRMSKCKKEDDDDNNGGFGAELESMLAAAEMLFVPYPKPRDPQDPTQTNFYTAPSRVSPWLPANQQAMVLGVAAIGVMGGMYVLLVLAPK